jgi:hypothetical protein
VVVGFSSRYISISLFHVESKESLICMLIGFIFDPLEVNLEQFL